MTDPNIDPNTDPNTQDSNPVLVLSQKLNHAITNVVFGQNHVVELLLVGLLAEGHILLEGLPGTAKTTLVKILSELLDLDFKRIQLTPDMLPAEITGTSIYDLNNKNFSFRQGPIFTDLLLADEINRTPPKTQSALLEAMEENQVTIDGNQYPLTPFFTVIATLNPVEFEGTYPLPEAQLDRFMMKILIDYPEQASEKTMLKEFSQSKGLRSYHQKPQDTIVTKDELLQARLHVTEVSVDDSVMDYILYLIQDTRQNPNLTLGCSPRSALSLMAASKAYAAMQGKNFVTPDHVKFVAPTVMRHRMMLNPEAELDGLTADLIIQHTLNKIAVPR